jgi:hypothetical protein
MEDVQKDPAVDATKGPSTDSKPGSGSDAGAGAGPDTGKATREGASQDTNQGATKESAGISASNSAGNSAKGTSPNSAIESAGKPPAQANADGSEELKLDPKMQKLVEAKIDARLKSLLESQMEPLLAVNRQVALFLGGQLENMIEMRQSVRAMERLLEADTRRKSKYAAMLEKVKGEGDGMQDPHWINRTRGMLSQLERSGTLGPTHDDGPAQA